MNIITIIKQILGFYLEGFQSMKVGRRLWAIIAIKFIVFFLVMKWLFFPNYLEENFSNDTQRAEHVMKHLNLEDN
ncbi:MAG: DUF4492 domain-containing protein [Campylobacterales bacterium]|nr:DUF4492 domain-containing protein [Campylobacterales bacterium]